MKYEIPYYDDFLSSKMLRHLLKQANDVNGVKGLKQIGTNGGLETPEALSFLCELYDEVKSDLKTVLNRRTQDRKFLDERIRVLVKFNEEYKRDFLEQDYLTPIGFEDGDGRVVWGPKTPDYAKARSSGKIAPLPEFLKGNHVTLFGPPDSTKLCINAMNSYHRKLKQEPEIVSELLKTCVAVPKWGADDEDSKTPLRDDLISAGENLSKCFDKTIKLEDYALEKDKLAHPIKRFPGLALPSFFLFYNEQPLPLHLYDFALHFFHHWDNEEALTFYVPKLENEEEARYIATMLKAAEKLIQKRHAKYKAGSIRLMIVLENPRAVFRVHEIIDELYPYFAGASLGWHDYLASTARLFKEDKNYRIPVKADPNIVIKYIKASHDLLTDVVGSRGGIKVGGMYGILPTQNDLMSPTFQVTMLGYIRDVITQLKRGLSGFWVAHPDFVRLGLALVEAWKISEAGDKSKLETLVKSLLDSKYHAEILKFIKGADIESLNVDDPMYARSLIVADLKESDFIANNHPDEIRYNVFQTLQYLADWLSGNGCVALPTQINGVAVRVMDDLATAERSRWEVWHEIAHGRFGLNEFLQIAHEEYHFIRKDLSNEKKQVQVKWDERTEMWYPVAMKLMIKLMTDVRPVEFATQLLLPFTLEEVRESAEPWSKVVELDAEKFHIHENIERFNYYFEMCGSHTFAAPLSTQVVPNLLQAKDIVLNFSMNDILAAASFHGDIGENKKTLDKMASQEQAKVLNDDDKIKAELRAQGELYLKKFGMKFLISAQGKSGSEILSVLKTRLGNSAKQEMENARNALWEITQKRILAKPFTNLSTKIEELSKKHKIKSAQVALSNGTALQSFTLGEAQTKTWFEMASLSKAVASAFAIEFFLERKIPLTESVDKLLAQTKSKYRLNNEKVQLAHLMNHTAINMHYVNGVPANKKMPAITEFLNGNAEYGYEPLKVINEPGTKFQYSGGGFIILEHLIEAMAGQSIFKLTRPFLDKLGMNDFSFEQQNISGVEYADGFTDKGELIEGHRKMFPAFAAGSMGTAQAMQVFTQHLENAYHDIDGSGPISHDTARMMLYGFDKGSQAFMGAKMGLGVFIAEAGENKIAIHQGANDGFRCIFVHCFFGPERGKGLVVLCNGELSGVLFISEVTQLVLKEWKMSGIEPNKFLSSFKTDNIPEAQIVNMGFKNLVFDTFKPNRPEPIIDRGPADPLAPYNLCVDGKVLSVTNELFARTENLLSDHLPKFDPELFGKQGKVMDSWETVRHNQNGFDAMVFEVKKPAPIHYVLLSTKYHFGNHSPVISLEGFLDGEWVEFLAKTDIEGHSEKRITLSKATPAFSKIQVKMYPDGGFSRLGLFSDILPEKEKKTFDGIGRVYEEKIPHTKKPLSLKYDANPEEIKRNYSKLKKGETYNVASASFGAKIVKASNEHYSPAVLVISPFAPLNMFDGMESARSRKPGHFEEVIVQLAKPSKLHRLEIDFTYFVNNNPYEIEIEGLSHGMWITLQNKIFMKPYAGNQYRLELTNNEIIEQIRVKTIPDGGLHRLKAFTTY
ncbi:MAG: serine hydrolase [Bacteriovoracaceae bacterium]|nr:serine hydrolase [Bacteriovoracaceae bacterium]